MERVLIGRVYIVMTERQTPGAWALKNWGVILSIVVVVAAFVRVEVAVGVVAEAFAEHKAVPAHGVVGERLGVLETQVSATAEEVAEHTTLLQEIIRSLGRIEGATGAHGGH